jgi:hypothetical protein
MMQDLRAIKFHSRSVLALSSPLLVWQAGQGALAFAQILGCNRDKFLPNNVAIARDVW